MKNALSGRCASTLQLQNYFTCSRRKCRVRIADLQFRSAVRTLHSDKTNSHSAITLALSPDYRGEAVRADCHPPACREHFVPAATQPDQANEPGRILDHRSSRIEIAASGRRPSLSVPARRAFEAGAG